MSRGIHKPCLLVLPLVRRDPRSRSPPNDFLTLGLSKMAVDIRFVILIDVLGERRGQLPLLACLMTCRSQRLWPLLTPRAWHIADIGNHQRNQRTIRRGTGAFPMPNCAFDPAWAASKLKVVCSSAWQQANIDHACESASPVCARMCVQQRSSLCIRT